MLFKHDFPLDKRWQAWYDTFMIYAITTIRIENEMPRVRTVGVFTSLQHAEEVLDNNWGDLNEAGYYPWAVIESVEEGLYPISPYFVQFYVFDRQNEKWNKCDKPSELWLEGFCRWSTIG
jgi:hypothetical protein